MACPTVYSRRFDVPEIEFPGVFIQEIPNDVHAIAGVDTSKAAFIGRAFRGEVDQPIEVTSFAEFEQEFGGRNVGSALGLAVAESFDNGGTHALDVLEIP